MRAKFDINWQTFQLYILRMVTIKSSSYAIGTFLLLMVSARAERIDSSCATYNSPNQPIVDTTGRYLKYSQKYYGKRVPLDTPSYYWQQGQWFQMPLGFQNPWPNDKALPFSTDRVLYEQLLSKRSKNTGFDPETKTYNPDLITDKRFGGKRFSFWMPSRRYVERDRRTSVAMRPCEAGRPTPTENEYVVSFQMEWAFQWDENYLSPMQWFNTASKHLKETGRVIGQEFYSEDHSRNGPITGKRRFRIYEDDGDLVVMLRGWPFIGPKAPINPICDGRVWQRSTNLVLYFSIAGDRCQLGNEQRWKKPVHAAIELIKQWRVLEK